MRLALHWQVLIGLAIGVLYAWMSITFGWNDFTIDYIKPFGDIFINVLKLIAVPLVLFSIISGVSSLGDPAKLGRLGIKTVITYLLTTMTAVMVGLLLVNVFQPGARVSDDLLESNRIRYEVWRDANGIEVLDDINLLNEPRLQNKVEEITGEQVQMNDWVMDKLTKAERTKSSDRFNRSWTWCPPTSSGIGRHVHAADHLLRRVLRRRAGRHAQGDCLAVDPRRGSAE